ncbi:hypothetical protein HDV00_007796 [Rhizophlyctis rosea]|nr:hypothetical protein HDV00_007796 [Rhizophlyctis rosea]
MAVHIHERHKPPSHDGNTDEDDDHRMPIFALVVVRNPVTGRFLVVEEFGSNGYWLPGGGVDPGEDYAAAAHRECLEEAGVDIELKGVLRSEFSPANQRHGPRFRTIFYAEPKDPSQKPKTYPDYESAGAAYVSVEDLADLPLRGNEPMAWFPYIANGGAVWPLSVIGRERDPVVFVPGPNAVRQ